MSRFITILSLALAGSLSLNIYLGTRVSELRSSIEIISERPSATEGFFVVTIKIKATDARTGEMIKGVKLRKVSTRALGEMTSGVSAAYATDGSLVLFAQGEEPIAVAVGTTGYQDHEFEISRMTRGDLEVTLSPSP